MSELPIIFLFFYPKIICGRHLSRSSGLESNIADMANENRQEILTPWHRCLSFWPNSGKNATE
jgi:hypothetical protein